MSQWVTHSKSLSYPGISFCSFSTVLLVHTPCLCLEWIKASMCTTHPHGHVTYQVIYPQVLCMHTVDHCMMYLLFPDPTPLFVHSGHEAECPNASVLVHSWQPRVGRNTILSVDSQASLHAWQWNKMPDKGCSWIMYCTVHRIATMQILLRDHGS